jgi:hypothetical protein
LRATSITVGVLYLLLAAVAVIAIDLRIVLIPAACASLALCIGGFVVFRRLNGALSIPFPARDDHATLRGHIVLEGIELTFQGYDQELIVAVRIQHLIELLGCLALAGTALYVMTSSLFQGPASGSDIGAYEAELICGAGLAVLEVNLRWFQERWYLRRSYYTVGALLSIDPGFFRRGITYQFLDNQNERRGGCGPFWGRRSDNLVLVLYDPKNPDTNIAHGAFLFHKFNVALIPSRARQKGMLNADR